MKKILFYYKSFNRFGGIERVLALLTNFLCEDFSITILTKDTTISNYILSDKIRIDTLGVMFESDKNRALKNIMKSRKGLKKYLKNNEFDYIYTATIIETFEIFLLGRKFLNKVIASEHGSYYAYNKYYRLLRKIIYPHIKLVISPTTTDTEIYANLGYRVKHIPNLISYQPYYGEMKKERIVLNVGRLTGDKQQLLLLKMWNDLVNEKKIEQWKLYIVGSGELEDQIKEFIIDHNLSDSVCLFPSTKKIDEFYKKASLFSFTSKMEGFGMVLIEAMAYSLPCISFDCPSGPRDIIKNEYNGYLIECYDENRYKEKLLELIKDRKKRLEMGKNALESIAIKNNDDILEMYKCIFNC